MHKTHSALRVLLVAAIALVPLAGLGTAASAQTGDGSDGVDLTVDVASPTATPQPAFEYELEFGKPAHGAPVTVAVKHLRPGSLTQLFVHSTPTLLASGDADPDGNIVLAGALPGDLAAGSHSITVTGTSVDGTPITLAVLNFEITAEGLLARTVKAHPSPLSPSNRAPATSGSAANVAQSTMTAPAAVAAALGSDAHDLGGGLTVSGLRARSVPTLAPGGGTIVLEFTVRNVSSVPTTPTLKFWLENALGSQVAAEDGIPVTNLAPAETRSVTATFKDVGQWTVFNGHVTLTPPTPVTGAALSPVSRDALVIVPPFFLLAVMVIIIGLYFAIRWVVNARRTSSVTAEAVLS